MNPSTIMNSTKALEGLTVIAMISIVILIVILIDYFAGKKVERLMDKIFGRNDRNA